MRIQDNGDTLRVSGVNELVAATTGPFRKQVLAAFTDQHRNIELDLGQTAFLDSSGLGILVGLHKAAASRHGHLRLCNPQPPVMQVLKLTRMHRVFEIMESGALSA